MRRPFTAEELERGLDIEMTKNATTFNTHDPDVIDVEPSASNELTKVSGKAPRRRGSTGPRTQKGKDRSKANATKFAIFSKITVLPSEPKEEFDAISKGLHAEYGPIGVQESLLVDHLVVLQWRRRRVIIAEAAEIRAGMEFVQWDHDEHVRRGAAVPSDLSCNGGLARWIADPQALQSCLDCLEKLRESVSTHGFNLECDKALLAKIYGPYEQWNQDRNWKKTLFDAYLAWQRTSLCSNEERKKGGYASPENCKERFLEELEEEVRRLQSYKEESTAIRKQRLTLESLRRSVPEGPQLDRLLRYEAAISREIERTLNQLERIQRMRAGQAVPPPINVNVTSVQE